MPLPKGTRTAHIQASHGPDSNMMKFYITQNSSTYGKHFANFKPRPGRHSGTGYLSNFRPGVYYNNRLDQQDNPALARICTQNYRSVTSIDFQSYKEHQGNEPLPFNTHQVGSGFVRQKPITFPLESEAKGVFIDTRAASAPANILPKSKPLLHSLRAKDPVELENSGYGPKYMLSETKQRFLGPQPERNGVSYYHVDTSGKTVGPKEYSGYVHAYNDEPITFIPGNPHNNERPGWATMRPTGPSIMKTSFQPSSYPKGDEPFSTVSHGSDRGSGFVREKSKPLYVHRVMGDAYDKAGDVPQLRLERTQKKDPTEYFNMQHPNNHSSIIMDTYKGQQRPTETECDRLGRTASGSQELSGYSENNDRFVATDDNPKRFVTHYMTRFRDRTEVGVDREGHCRGGLQDQKPDGFTKSTSVHSYGPEIQSTETLRRLHPYVARSLQARDVFFDDHTYDSKLHSSQQQPVAAMS
ncbi:protein phosphatase 1 regulatory subunit 32-like isoform X1 [Mercenaria mercenaria]|uniref:protein phosphatase 1 regulatory subunit 32-like isoform X1 n=1 Tax=Mercenaria mercenaria TaxID=6596 RepID=UPI00234E6F01|nr:protein phosphatase 1 regulatory subunit 32-like isoform X1 [Mercenaria mercenaria]XP_045197134.2 protein phosphatase 1 regulatory subunit 32-like isoform X1 [Mercenaria mercenaria]XP_045197135.2 protein phosphatase 1 regulatory subunit 32-like isoform X1 [Mercenaria mercenaria]